MKVIYLRDGASASLEGPVFSFTGAAGAEFLNVRRTTPMMPPTHVLSVKPDTLFKIHTGIGLEHSLLGVCIDARATKSYWRNHGVRVERVDTEEVSPGVYELIVYITSMNSFDLNPREMMFESFQLAATGELEIFTGELPTKANGFVPIAKRQITDTSNKKGQDAPKSPTELSDDEKRASMDKWLNTPDKKSDPAGQTVEAGAPPVDVLKRGGVSADPGVRADVKERGGVRAL